MTKDNKLVEERKKKIADWEAQGFSGYSEKFDRTHTAAQAHQEAEKSAKKWRDVSDILSKGPTSDIKMCGRLMNFREMGKLAFMRLRDVSGDFQIALAKDVLGDKFKPYSKMLDLGDFIGFSGEFFVTNHGEPTLLAAEMVPLSKSIRPLPEKWAGLKDKEECYRHRHLDLISNPETLKRFRLRSQVVTEIRAFLESRDFMEVETPIIQQQAGGAMAKVFETHHNALDQDMVLRIALEIEHKILVAGGIERLYEIGKCFRNEGTDPSHLQEFSLLEWYWAYADLNDNMELNQEMIQHICTKIFGTTKVTVLDKEDNPVKIDFSGKFPRKRFPDLLKEYANVDMETITQKELAKLCADKYEMSTEEAQKTSRGNLLDHIYKKTARPHMIQPTFVLDYPSDVKPLARPKGDGTADCYQLLVAGWEIINAYGELIDPQVQRKLLEEQASARAAGDDEAMQVDENFLGAMEVGMPPMTGIGMGIDRFVALLTAQPNLRDVTFFPLMKPEHAETAKSKDTKIAVALINDSLDLEPWQELNTIGHLSAALGAREGKRLFLQDEIVTKDGQRIKLNIEHAIMLKTAPSHEKIRETLTVARERDIHVAEFIREMIETSDDRKIVESMKGKNWDEVEYLGALFFGNKKQVEALTKEFPLYGGSNAPKKSASKPASVGVGDTMNFEPGISREKAHELLEQYADKALQRHCAYVANAMESLCHHFGHSEQVDSWYIAGLLHDIDWNHTIDNPEDHCGEMLEKILTENSMAPELLEVIQSHYPFKQVPLDSPIKQALFACDELSGFAVAVALMRPTKMMGISPKSVIKKMKDKQFAAAVSREDMKACEEFFDMPVSEFLSVLIPGFEKIAPDWELAE